MTELELLVQDALDAQVPLRLDRVPVWDEVLARAEGARSPRRWSRRRRRVVLALAVVVLAVVVAGSVWAALGHSPVGGLTWSGSSGSRGATSTIYVARAGGQVDELTHAKYPAWSPDGSRLHVLEADGLHVIPADGSSDVRLPPVCGGVPIWAPDSRSIACYTGGPLSIDIVAVDGRGAPHTLIYRTSGTGFSWSPDGHRIVYANKVERHPGIFVVNTEGAPRSTEIELRAQPWSAAASRLAHGPTYRGPLWSPDGSWIAFQWDDRTGMNEWIYVMRPDGTGVTRVGRGWISGWSPDGRLLAFTRSQSLRSASLWVTNADGSELRRLCDSDCGGGTWLPDSKRLADSSQRQIIVVNADGSGRTVVARTSLPYDGFSLSPDGRTIAYVGGKGRNRDHNLYIVGVDGSGRKLVAHSSTTTFGAPSWRPRRTPSESNRKGSTP